MCGSVVVMVPLNHTELFGKGNDHYILFITFAFYKAVAFKPFLTCACEGTRSVFTISILMAAGSLCTFINV